MSHILNSELSEHTEQKYQEVEVPAVMRLAGLTELAGIGGLQRCAFHFSGFPREGNVIPVFHPSVAEHSRALSACTLPPLLTDPHSVCCLVLIYMDLFNIVVINLQ